MKTSEVSSKKLTLFPLVLMIFTSVYGFANMPRAYFLMGYGAIIWYLFGALTFFLPYALMMAEYGAAFRKEKGGIYSWMSISVGPRYAFVGTFMWYASYLVWQVNVSSSIWIPLSTAFFGEDLTRNLRLGPLHSTQVIGLLGVLWIILITLISSKGLDKIQKVTSVGGIAVTLLNVVLILGGILVLILNNGQLAQPIENGLKTFVTSPNPSYQSTLSILSFLTFAIFAYGGIEAVGGLVDQTKNAKSTFPKGVMISAIVISAGYAIGIFVIGFFTNWQGTLSEPWINSGNITYVVMQNLGYMLSRSMGAPQISAVIIGTWFARFVGLSMFLTYTGAFFTLIYSPLKQLIEGTPKELWPKSFTVQKNGMPVNAMYFQALIIIVLILLVSFGGENASIFFDKLVIMTNVAMTIPYMFLAAAFPFFKNKEEIDKPFVVYKNKTLALILAIVITTVIGFANIFAIIEPALTRGRLADTLLAGGGPLFFALLALLLYQRYQNKQK